MWPLIISDYFRSEVTFRGLDINGLPFFEIPQWVFFQEAGWLEIEVKGTLYYHNKFYYNRSRDSRYSIIHYNPYEGFLKLQKDHTYSERIRREQQQTSRPERDQRKQTTNRQNSKDVTHQKEGPTYDAKNNHSEVNSNANNAGAGVKVYTEKQDGVSEVKQLTQRTTNDVHSSNTIHETSPYRICEKDKEHIIDPSISSTRIKSEKGPEISDNNKQQQPTKIISLTNCSNHKPPESDHPVVDKQQRQQQQNVLHPNKDNRTTEEDALTCTAVQKNECTPLIATIHSDKNHQSHDMSSSIVKREESKETLPLGDTSEAHISTNRTTITTNKPQARASDMHVAKNNLQQNESITNKEDRTNETKAEHCHANKEDNLQENKERSGRASTSGKEANKKCWNSLSYIEKYHQPRNADVKSAIQNAANELFAKHNKKYKRHIQSQVSTSKTTITTTNIAKTVNVRVRNPAIRDRNSDRLSQTVSRVSECSTSATECICHKSNTGQCNKTTTLPASSLSVDSIENGDGDNSHIQLKESYFQHSKARILEYADMTQDVSLEKIKNSEDTTSLNIQYNVVKRLQPVLDDNRSNVLKSSSNVLNGNMPSSIMPLSALDEVHTESLESSNTDHDSDIEEISLPQIYLTMQTIKADKTADNPQMKYPQETPIPEQACILTKPLLLTMLMLERQRAIFREHKRMYNQEMGIAAANTVRMLIETIAQENRTQSFADINNILTEIINYAVQTAESNIASIRQRESDADAEELFAQSQTLNPWHHENIVPVAMTPNEVIVNISKGLGQLLTLKDEHGRVQLRLNLSNHTIVQAPNTAAQSKQPHTTGSSNVTCRSMVYAEEVTNDGSFTGNHDNVSSLDTSYYGLEDFTGLNWTSEAASWPFIAVEPTVQVRGNTCGLPMTPLQQRVCMFCDCDKEPCHVTKQEILGEPGTMVDDDISRDTVTFNRAPGAPLR